ncbi:MAG TPA: molecular chaperone TorD family protein, partial [Chthonomonadales bacterium]|nr:molecular chaperone TorD family protein [Chthonomonadales bacterium]
MKVATTTKSDRPMSEHATNLALRSCLLRLLALSLGYPTVDRFEAMRKSLETCIEYRDRLPKRIAERLSQFAAAIQPLDHDAYESKYLKVFTHVCAADCNPCETSYMAKHIFQVSQRMAAITGFYRAFGLETSGERPDHVAVELEFLAFLCYRESLEWMEGSRQNALTMRQGQRRFLERHLGKWVGAFTVLMKRKAQTGAMYLLADLLERVVRSEAARHRV